MRLFSLLRRGKDAIFPLDITCDICGRETFGSNLCPECTESVIFNVGATCPVCGRKVTRAEICMECKEKPPLYKKAVSALTYSEGTAALIFKFKNGYPYLGEFLGKLMVEKLVGFPKIDIIVYVPLTKFSLFRRGYNPSAILAKKISLATGTRKVRAIKRVRRGKPQKGLSKKEREENVRHAFRVTKPELIDGKRVLLIDDVMTTGATADEITLILNTAGAKVVYIATAASVEYKPATKKAQEKDKKASK